MTDHSDDPTNCAACGTSEGHLQMAELQMMEPPLARTLRQCREREKKVTVCALDGTSIFGMVDEVAEDGTTVTINRPGEGLFVFDVAAVVVVRIGV